MSQPISNLPAERKYDSLWIAFTIGACAVILQMFTNGQYGYFRDELYYLAASDHLAFGYVDFAPLIAVLTHLSRAMLGSSLHAIRLLPALAFGAEILLTGLITQELGGRRWATLLACISVLTAPVILANANRLSMNPLEPLFWMGALYFVLLTINRNQPTLLVWSGVLLGLGLENKHSTIFFISALVVGLLLTDARSLLRSKWFWIAVVITVAIALPNFVWQYLNHFPTLEDLRNVKALHKNVELPPLPFLQQQLMTLGPISALVWIPGLIYVLFVGKVRRYRFVGITYLAFLGVMMYLKGKDYYLAPIYPVLYAAGATFWEHMASQRQRLRWVKIAMPAAILLSGCVTVPIVLPILPPDRVAPYFERLGVDIPRTENGMQGLLPQYFADEFGWPEMVATVADVYHALPADEQAHTAILAGNYGGAGAIDFFGPQYGLPKAISAHQNYYLWGTRDFTGESIILLEWNLREAQYWCGSVEQGPEIHPYYGMSWEHYNILICHDLKIPLKQAWPEFKFWN
jgi:hypothetical protein